MRKSDERGEHVTYYKGISGKGTVDIEEETDGVRKRQQQLWKTGEREVIQKADSWETDGWREGASRSKVIWHYFLWCHWSQRVSCYVTHIYIAFISESSCYLEYLVVLSQNMADSIYHSSWIWCLCSVNPVCPLFSHLCGMLASFVPTQQLD